jgi:hypothetical protein
MTGMACVFLTGGCKVAQFVQHAPESHFNFPNSNVTPMGPVKVSEAGEFCLFVAPDLYTSDYDEKVYAAAFAQQPGSNLIIDYDKNYRAYEFWPFMWSTLELEGTACRAEVAKQPLK